MILATKNNINFRNNYQLGELKSIINEIDLSKEGKNFVLTKFLIIKDEVISNKVNIILFFYFLTSVLNQMKR